jgi:cellulose synthase/poly-beta-1,6-N-acetylglucosamine synthase-like glycosyltransferase
MGLKIEKIPSTIGHIATMAECHSQAFSGSQLDPILTVIVPVYNEANTIDQLLRCVLAAPYAKQVIVVDDGSTDGTAEVLQKWLDNPHIEIVKHPNNR